MSHGAHAPAYHYQLPCYTPTATPTWKMPAQADYHVVKEKPFFNVRNNIPTDLNWGRGDVLWTRPQWTFENPAGVATPTDYRYLPYYDGVAFTPIAPHPTSY